jgi:endogenous inhibitor of DNA gyrase (YacG/DUF329 family)
MRERNEFRSKLQLRRPAGAAKPGTNFSQDFCCKMSSGRCPICGRLFVLDESPAMPFCSQRCKNVDLGRWLDEEYGLPYEASDENEPESHPPTAGPGETGA